MDTLSLCGIMLATPVVDFALYSTSSLLTNPRTFTLTMQRRALRDWHGNTVNYLLTWYLLACRFTWDAPGLSDGWRVLSYFAIVDVAFYALHRACHRFLYYPIHQKHHLCQPVGSHCARHSHWLDATLENVSFFTPFFVLSYSAYVAFACLLLNGVWASYIHTYPTRVERGAWMVSPYLHWIHHQCGGASSCNYALYFTIWDRLLGTLNEESKVALVAHAPMKNDVG